MLIRLLILLGLGWFAKGLLSADRVSADQAAPTDEFERRVRVQDAGPGPNAETFADALDRLIRSARAKGASYVDINAGKLHRQVGGYPGPAHRMQTCCSVMRSALRTGDMVLSEPRSGVGATLTLRYHLQA